MGHLHDILKKTHWGLGPKHSTQGVNTFTVHCVWQFLHLITGCGVRHGFQGRGGLTNKDVPFTGDGPDGLFGRRTMESSGVTAGNTQQGHLENRKHLETVREERKHNVDLLKAAAIVHYTQMKCSFYITKNIKPLLLVIT